MRNTALVAAAVFIILSRAACGSDEPRHGTSSVIDPDPNATIEGKNPDGTVRWSDGWNVDPKTRSAYQDLPGGVRLIRYPDGHVERVQLPTPVGGQSSEDEPHPEIPKSPAEPKVVRQNPDGSSTFSDGVTAYPDGSILLERGGQWWMRYPNGKWQRLPTSIVTRKDPRTGVERYYRIGPDSKAVEIKFPGEAAPKQANQSRNSSDSPTASGTGFFVSPDGYLLTNYHLVGGARKIVIRTGEVNKPAKVVRNDTGNDLALLKIEGNFDAIPLGDARAVAVGDSVMTIGYPNIEVQGSAAKFTRGEVSSLTGFQDDARLFQISVPIQPGNSGGPLVDVRGNAVGITNAQLSALKMIVVSGSVPQNVNYAVKISYAQLLLDSIPEIAAKLPKPHTGKGEPATIIDETQKATALIIVWQ